MTRVHPSTLHLCFLVNGSIVRSGRSMPGATLRGFQSMADAVEEHSTAASLGWSEAPGGVSVYFLLLGELVDPDLVLGMTLISFVGFLFIS